MASTALSKAGSLLSPAIRTAFHAVGCGSGLGGGLVVAHAARRKAIGKAKRGAMASSGNITIGRRESQLHYTADDTSICIIRHQCRSADRVDRRLERRVLHRHPNPAT